MADKKWVITNTDYTFKTMRDKNTVFTISNGYLALKGNVHEYKFIDYSATYIAGVFGISSMIKLEGPSKYKRIYHNPEYYDTAKPGRSIANLPDPLMVELFVDDKQITFKRGKVESFNQYYFLKSGLYQYDYIYIAPDGKRTAIQVMRFADMTNLHRAYMRYLIKPLNYSGSLRISTGIDGMIKSNHLDEKQFQVVKADTADNQNCSMKANTIPEAAEVRLLVASRINVEYQKKSVYEEERIYDDFIIDAKEGQEIILDKFIVLGSSDDAKFNVALDLDAELKQAEEVGFKEALAEQKKFWSKTWERIDVEIAGDEMAQLCMRFSLYHLMCSQPRHTDRLTIPCKLLTGEYYQGTAFYDTDLYIEPFFLGTYPEMARKMLMFRYNILNESREIARKQGYSGAKYAWQVGPTGEEELGKWWALRKTNIHINADIVYSIMQYYYSTQDMEFMVTKAVDMLVESSRFYLSRSEYDKATDTYNIDKVAGPDEAHCDSKNNFYTNYLVKQCLLNTVDSLEKMKANYQAEYQSAVERLWIKESEPSDWKNMAEKIVLLYEPKTKLYEQAEGFFNLPLVPEERLEAHRKEKVWWMPELFEFCQTNQPDVTMLIFMYRHHFDLETIKTNWEYYNRRNFNFSSMSWVVNAVLAKEVGDMKFAYKSFLTTAGLDLDLTLTRRFDTFQGIHGTSAGGAWIAAVYGFGGINITENKLLINPKIPHNWHKLKFKLFYQGELLDFQISQKELQISLDKKKNIEILAEFFGKPIKLKSGQAYNLQLS